MEQVYGVKEFIININGYFFLLLRKWKFIGTLSLIGAILGFTLSKLDEPNYQSTLTFVVDSNQKSNALGSLSGLIGSSMGDGNMFNKLNVINFITIRSLLEEALLKKVENQQNENLSYADLYLDVNGIRDKWEGDLKNVSFPANSDRNNLLRVQDSILGKICTRLVKNKEIIVKQPDEQNSIVELTTISKSEVFAKEFPSILIEVVKNYYIETVVSKKMIGIKNISHQLDSVRRELNSSINMVASSADNTFGLNPALSVKRVPGSQSQVDVQVNSAMMIELIKNLETTKLSLLNETPNITVIDYPKYPLEKKFLSLLKGVLIGGFIFLFISVLIVLYRNILSVK